MKLAFVLALAATLSAQPKTLKDAYEGAFRVGGALNQWIVSGTDAEAAAVAAAQFNTITPENCLKWEVVHPKPGTYNFTCGDATVAFGEKNEMKVIGHTLVWHSQTPRWVFESETEPGKPKTRDELLALMKEHIVTVMGRYKGRIKGWDVVNEALNEDGTMRQSQWFKIIGPDFVAKAFQFAREVDPACELNYNDYNLAIDAKRAGAIRLVKELQSQGIKVDVVGMQGHLKLNWPSAEQEDKSIKELAALGVKIAITELDVDVLPARTASTSADVSRREQAAEELNPYKEGLPKEVEQALARRYTELFQVFLKNKDVLNRVTFWGVSNKETWLNNFPIRGRTNHPLLFDRARKPTPSFDAVLAVAPAAKK